MKYFLVGLVVLCVASLGTLGASMLSGKPVRNLFYAGCALSVLVPLVFLYYHSDLVSYYRSHYRYVKLGFVVWFFGVAVIVAAALTYEDGSRLSIYISGDDDEDGSNLNQGKEEEDRFPGWQIWLVVVAILLILGVPLWRELLLQYKRNSLLKVASKDEVTDILAGRVPEDRAPLPPPVPKRKRKVVFFPHFHETGQNLQEFKADMGDSIYNEEHRFGILKEILDNTLPALEEGKTVVFGVEKNQLDLSQDNADYKFRASELFEIRGLLKRMPLGRSMFDTPVFSNLSEREKELLFRAYNVEPAVLMKKMALVDPALKGKIKLVSVERGVIPEVAAAFTQLRKLNQEYIGAPKMQDAVHYASNVYDKNKPEMLEEWGDHWKIPKKARNMETLRKFWEAAKPYVNDTREVAMLSNMEREVAKYGDDPNYSFAFTFGDGHDFYRYRDIYDFELVIPDPLHTFSPMEDRFDRLDPAVTKVREKARLSLPGQRMIEEEMSRIRDEFRKKYRGVDFYKGLYLSSEQYQNTINDLIQARALLKDEVIKSKEVLKLIDQEGFSQRAQELHVKEQLMATGKV